MSRPRAGEGTKGRIRGRIGDDGGGRRGEERRAETRNRRQDCYSTLPPGGAAGERSSVKPLIMPKQYTVGAPVSVADPRRSRLVPSKFRASNEFELESAPPNANARPILRHRKLPGGTERPVFLDRDSPRRGEKKNPRLREKIDEHFSVYYDNSRSDFTRRGGIEFEVVENTTSILSSPRIGSGIFGGNERSQTGRKVSSKSGVDKRKAGT